MGNYYDFFPLLWQVEQEAVCGRCQRELHPKQFLRLTGERSMLQETISRLDGLDILEPILICNEEHRFLAAETDAANGLIIS